jgi:hypothetical protein
VVVVMVVVVVGKMAGADGGGHLGFRWETVGDGMCGGTAMVVVSGMAGVAIRQCSHILIAMR